MPRRTIRAGFCLLRSASRNLGVSGAWIMALGLSTRACLRERELCVWEAWKGRVFGEGACCLAHSTCFGPISYLELKRRGREFNPEFIARSRGDPKRPGARHTQPGVQPGVIFKLIVSILTGHQTGADMRPTDHQAPADAQQIISII
ncbi:hypothetical protein Dimus_007068 [Dionaea muscipula]